MIVMHSVFCILVVAFLANIFEIRMIKRYVWIVYVLLGQHYLVMQDVSLLLVAFLTQATIN